MVNKKTLNTKRFTHKNVASNENRSPLKRENALSQIRIIIPAFNPESVLVDVVRELLDIGSHNILVVNDGSAPQFEAVFNTLKADNITVIEHTHNMGKGAAIKSGIRYWSKKKMDTGGVVIVDADGQHLTPDIRNVISRLKEEPQCLVIGTRSFNTKAPFLRYCGNLLTKYIFWFAVQTFIEDTQSGLRGIPASLFLPLLSLKENKYDFELAMLITAKELKIPIIAEPIETVYINGTNNSHFNLFVDAYKIYSVLARYLLKSRLTSV
jgi:glycosyltransferase involved in cell wall biosynthesis